MRIRNGFLIGIRMQTNRQRVFVAILIGVALALERWSLDDINRWYNTSVYQRSNEATKEWCNK